MWIQIFLFVIISETVRSQTVAYKLPPARPPPRQNNDYVDDFLDDLLGRKPKHPPASGNTTAGNKTAEVDPWTFVNETVYWDTEHLMPDASIGDVAKAQMWLNGYLAEAEKMLKMTTKAGWNYLTNLTDHNRKSLVESEKVCPLRALRRHPMLPNVTDHANSLQPLSRKTIGIRFLPGNPAHVMCIALECHFVLVYKKGQGHTPVT
jgi:hypothetical protein